MLRQSIFVRMNRCLESFLLLDLQIDWRNLLLYNHLVVA